MKKSWIRKNWLNLVLILGLAAVVIVRFYGNPKSLRFQDLSLEDMDGQTVNMDQFRGKPMLLHFWATWCGPCRSEMPALAAAHHEFGEEIAFVLVSDEKVNTLKRFRQQFALDLPIYHKPSSIKLKGIFSIPQTYLINREGEVVESFEGAVNWNSPGARQLLESL